VSFRPRLLYNDAMRALLALPIALVLSGCLARTAVDIVTLPVRVVSAGVDAVTVSQSEADQRRGRELREAEEREGRIARRCARNPDRDECRDRRDPDEEEQPRR
jgi:uncharacterized lipoprotein YajG